MTNTSNPTDSPIATTMSEPVWTNAPISEKATSKNKTQKDQEPPASHFNLDQDHNNTEWKADSHPSKENIPLSSFPFPLEKDTAIVLFYDLLTSYLQLII